MRTIGVMTMIAMWSPRKMIPPKVKVAAIGLLNPGTSFASLFKTNGMMSSMAPRIWATPMVATVRMSRGALENRRMIAHSMKAEDRVAMTRPKATAAMNGQRKRSTSSAARVAAKAPSSPWAKLMMRLVR